MRSWIPGVVAVLAVGCGGGSSPSTPSVVATPAPAATPLPGPSFRDGATDEPLGAQITPATPTLDAVVSVRAPGFLVREQRYDGRPIFLWPGDEGYVRELAYKTEFTDGSFRMVKWASGFTWTLDGDLQDDPAVVRKVREVAAEITRVTGLSITIGPGGACVLVIDPSDPDIEGAVALARTTYRGANIASARVVFASRPEIAGGARSDYRNTLLHEMGHVMGLGHSPSDRDVMTPGSGPGAKVGEFQAGEATCLRLMYLYRKAGNFPPDRDPAVSTARDATPRTRVIVD